MAERSIATRCKRVALRATGVRIPLDAQLKKTGVFPVFFNLYLHLIYITYDMIFL